MRILCGPKGQDGKREGVSNSCSEKCPFWNQCLEEIGMQELPNHFIEETPNKYELEDGIFHVDYKGLKKVWILTKKRYGI
jgi:hypothetical protein